MVATFIYWAVFAVLAAWGLWSLVFHVLPEQPRKRQLLVLCYYQCHLWPFGLVVRMDHE